MKLRVERELWLERIEYKNSGLNGREELVKCRLF